jgi:transposase
MLMWCGIDWAEHHHDVAVIDEAGQLRARLRIGDDAAGFTALLELLATHRLDCAADIPVAIETAKGLLVANLRAAGITVFAINPLSVSRYRDRYSPSRAKSDAADALVLANILRTDAGSHRVVPDDSELAGSIRVLARAHQDAIWDRMQTAGKLRSVLREYYPTFLAAFDDLTSREARATLQLVASPGDIPRLRRTSLVAALRRAGRRRLVDDAADRILAKLKTEQLRQPPLVEAAMAQQALAYARVLDTMVANIAALEVALETAYLKHPDAAIIGSFPGLGIVLGARMLGEIGDDRTRFADAHGLKAFAGTAPVTRASGMKTVVTRRVIRNKRLGQVAYLWALPMLAHSPGARAHYDRRRTAGDTYSAAARNLSNRGLGMLHHCLQTRQPYNENKAFQATTTATATSGKPSAGKAHQQAQTSPAEAVA